MERYVKYEKSDRELLFWQILQLWMQFDVHWNAAGVVNEQTCYFTPGEYNVQAGTSL